MRNKINFSPGAKLIAVGALMLTISVEALPQKVSRQEQVGELFRRWATITGGIPTYKSLYFFEVTNPVQVKNGTLPELKEVGPFVIEEKQNIVVENVDRDGDAIQYSNEISRIFRKDLSVVAGNNMTIQFNNMENVFGGARFRDAAKYHFDQSRHVEYPDEIIIRSGIIEPQNFGELIEFNGERNLSLWHSESCNMFNGSLGSAFPPSATKDHIITVFSTHLDRSIYLVYKEDVQVLGLTGYKFVVPRDVLEDPRINPENVCYCKREKDSDLRECLRAGAHPSGSYGSDYFSWPHFFDGDKSYLEQLSGLKPDAEKHQTYIVLEPETGTVLKSSYRVQINSGKYFDGLYLTIPQMWSDESREVNPENAEMIKKWLAGSNLT